MLQSSRTLSISFLGTVGDGLSRTPFYSTVALEINFTNLFSLIASQPLFLLTPGLIQPVDIHYLFPYSTVIAGLGQI
jgi:hypothetical protein